MVALTRRWISQWSRVGLLRSTAVSICAIAGAATLLSSPSAFALSQRGHTLSSSFGSPGSAEGQLSGPSGIAVSEVGEAAGDVYVVDRGNNRIERFDAQGALLSVWGFGVKDGAKTYEVCLAGEACKAGLPDTGKGAEHFHLGEGELRSPEEIAVDNSTSPSDPSKGDVYVVASVVPERSFVYKYGPNGEYKGPLGNGAKAGKEGKLTTKEESEEFGRPDGVAVDPRGEVWVDWSEDEIVDYTDGEPNTRVDEEEAVEPEELLRPWLAVDPHDNLYVNYEPGEAFEQGEEGLFAEEGRGENGEEPCEASPCFVPKLSPVTIEFEGEREEIEPGGPLIRSVDGAGARPRPVAVDPADEDVYVDEGANVAAFTSTGALIQRFGVGQLSSGAGVAVDSSTGTVYVADAQASKVDVFTLEGPGSPTVEEPTATEITAETVLLSAQVDPVGGAGTTVTFEYGAAPCTGGTCLSQSVPGDFGEGYANALASARVLGLAPQTTYYYRAVVRSSLGHAVSDEGSFTTQPPAHSFALPDGRGIELVSPAEKNGAGIETLPKEGGLIQAAADGSAFTYISTGPSEADPEGNRSPAFTQNLANRVEQEGKPAWSSKEIAIKFGSALGDFPGELQEYLLFSSDLELAMIEPRGLGPKSDPPLSDEAAEKTPYIRHNEGCQPAPSSCYQALVTPGDDTAEPKLPYGGSEGQAGSGLRFQGASPDLTHVVLASEVPLTDENAASGAGLYEWSGSGPLGEALAPAQQLHLVSVLPDGGPATSAVLGSAGVTSTRNAVSAQRVVWRSGSALYDRNVTRGETLKVNAGEPGAEPGPTESATYQTASSDGSRVFFTDEQRLIAGTTATDASDDDHLYEWDATTDTLSDVAPGSGAEPVGVRGLVPGASEDGSTVYFVANGVLDSTANGLGEKAVAGKCIGTFAPPEATCNLYVAHRGAKGWESPRFIARLPAEDANDWSEGDKVLGALTSRVSPKGQYIAFMSDRPLTGYDNRDANATSEGARDEEVFVYDDQSQRLVCASCNAPGSRPHGVYDTLESSEAGLLVDRSGNWAQRWIAGSIPAWTLSENGPSFYQSRYLSDNGRLFFDSADALAPEDVNGMEDVYEYEPNGTGGCHQTDCVALISSGTSDRESAFLDASDGGDDVFMLTSSELVPADRDTNFDVYDAHVCSEQSPCVSSSLSETNPCDTGSSCNPTHSTTPAGQSPATANVSGAGNLPGSGVSPIKVVKLTRAQQLAKALKACKRIKRKRARRACDKRAHKRWGPKRRAHRHAKKKTQRARG